LITSSTAGQNPNFFSSSCSGLILTLATKKDSQNEIIYKYLGESFNDYKKYKKLLSSWSQIKITNSGYEYKGCE